MLLIWLILWTTEGHARGLGYRDGIEQVNRSNPELQSARASLTSAQEVVSGASAAYFPEADLSFSTVRQSPASGLGDPLRSLGGQVRWNLFAGGRDLAGVRQARAREALALASLDQVRARISFQYRRAYAQLQYARELVILTERIRDRRSQNERLVRALYENGRENKGSYLLSKALLDQAIFETRVARDQAVIAAQQLAHVLGEDSFDLEARDSIPLTDPPPSADAKEFLPETPAHRIRNAQFELAEAQTSGAWSGFSPRLDLTGSSSARGAEWLPDQNRQWSLGLSLTLPLFSGLSTVRDVRSRKALQEAAEADRITADFEILSELRQSLFSFQQAVEKLRVDLETLEAATIRATISRKRYNNGILMFEQWDIIETDLINRQKTALLSKRDRIIAEGSWMQSRGKGDLP
jgi:outer membrane protein